jgi:dTDP-4-dehydrorhamnose reductase
MRILVTGACGRLGSYLMARLALGAHDVIGSGRRQPETWSWGQFQPLDLADPAGVAVALSLTDPEVVIHLAAISSADLVRRDPGGAWKINVEGTRLLSDWTSRNARRLVLASTDLVFDGTRSWYREDDPTNAILEYGCTKRAAEIEVGASRLNLTVRISLLYGKAPAGKEGFFDRAVASLRAGVPMEFFADEYRTPLDYATAATALVKLADSTVSGVIHLGGPERLSRFELMSRAAAGLGIRTDLVRPTTLSRAPLAEPRPADVSLDTTRLKNEVAGLKIPAIETAVEALNH